MQRKWAIVLVAVCVVVTVAAVAYAAGKATAEVPEVIRAQRFELVDEDGALRAVMGPLSDGKFFLSLYGQEGTPVASLGAQSWAGGDAGRLILHGARGDVWLDATPSGGLLRLRENGEPFRQCLIDHAGITLKVGLEPGLSGVMSEPLTEGQRWLSPEERRRRAELRVGEAPDWLPMLNLMDGTGQRRADLGVSDGRPALTLRDEGGKRRAALGATDVGNARTGTVETRAESSLLLFDKDGKVLWEAP